MTNDFKYLVSDQVSCPGMENCNGLYQSPEGGCQWNRKFKITCTLVNSEVYVRVQTNSLPDHCFALATGKVAFENFIDFKVKFDSDPTELQLTTFTNQSEI